MVGDSFQFGKFNSLTDWGIRCIAHDVLLPPKRERKIKIPNRHGVYDYGSKFYDERTLSIDCVLEKQIKKSELREIIYYLSGKNKLILWNEPNKYYVAELFGNIEVTDFPQETMREFTLDFTCEPFTYSDTITQQIVSGRNKLKYNGTAETPTFIIIKNNQPVPISNIKLTLVRRLV